MKMLQVLLLGVAIAIALPQGVAPVLAQGSAADSLAAARELARITTAGVLPQIMRAYSERTWPQVEAKVRQKNPNLDAAAVAELRKEFTELQLGVLRDVMADAAPVYARHFTLKELRDLVAFYKSPTGKKAIVAMPQASMEMLAGLAPRLDALTLQVNQKFADILKKRGFTP
jgi:hypothetical protein